MNLNIKEERENNLIDLMRESLSQVYNDLVLNTMKEDKISQ
jgi:hypothetical protein